MLYAVSDAAGQQVSAYEAGQKAFRARDYASASASFQQAEREAGGRTDAALFLARCLSHLDRFNDAESALERYLALHPRDAEGLFLRGYLRFRENRAGASLEAYTEAAKVSTPRADDLKIVALDYVLLRDDAAALRWLKRSLEMNGNDAEAWYFLGRAYFSQSQFAEAERAFRESLRLDPAEQRAHNNLGLTLEAENRPVEALHEYQQSVALDRLARTHGGAGQGKEAPETQVQPYLNLGKLLVLQNSPTEAAATLREALAIDAGCVECHLQLGRALAREDKLAEARVEIEAAVRMKPDDAALHYELGLLYQRSGDKVAAQVELARSKKLYDTHAAGPGTP